MREIQHYLGLRVKVLARQLAEMGWLRLLLLSPMLLAASGQGMRLIGQYPVGQWLLPVLGAGMCLSSHRQRRDLAFLQSVAPNYHRLLLAEYVVWQLPLWGVLLVYSAWLPLLLGLVLIPLIPYVAKLRAARGDRRHQSLLRSELFEWVSGYRRSGAWLVWAVGVGVALWQRHNTVAALVPVLWALLLTSFYSLPEDSVMLLQYPLRLNAFLRRKLGLALVGYWITSLPFVLLLGTGAVSWGGALAVLLWGAVILTMVVLAKYAFYPHAGPVQVGVVVLALLVVVNSVYVALLAAAFAGLVWKSRRHLLQYRWHD
ncbi:hypothetical protein [Hymenobacter crusticola]|uniref:ABC transporter permease n=1 Tax=Hymenobacter crusticola TaxID=1770526 RepID=A0A243WF73_9BACT|nr:hypothetical protein [Hymenobacter crusticola]OUJ74302.1 hypothetical protein BXP70_11335 [Hymenobacter crusticola]